MKKITLLLSYVFMFVLLVNTYNVLAKEYESDSKNFENSSIDDPWIGVYKYSHYIKSLGGYDVPNNYTVKIFKDNKKGYNVDIYAPSLAFLELKCLISKTKKNLICFPLHRHIRGGFEVFKEEVMYIDKNKNNQIEFKFSDELKEKLKKSSSDLANINNKGFLYNKIE